MGATYIRHTSIDSPSKSANSHPHPHGQAQLDRATHKKLLLQASVPITPATRRPQQNKEVLALFNAFGTQQQLEAPAQG